MNNITGGIMAFNSARFCAESKFGCQTPSASDPGKRKIRCRLGEKIALV
jgi:hypothetical protein